MYECDSHPNPPHAWQGEATGVSNWLELRDWECDEAVINNDECREKPMTRFTVLLW